MSKEVGGGLAKWWQLPDWHKFQPAFVQHDASHDAIEIFLEQAKLSDFLGDDFPVEYVAFIEVDLLLLNSIFRHRAFNRKDAVKLFVDTVTDIRLKEMCDALSKNCFDKAQVKLFYSLVRTYSFFKY